METEILALLLGAVLPLYPLLFAIYQKTAGTTRSSRSSRDSGTSMNT